MDKLSFVIPSFNSAAWLAHAIQSARKQTYANIEIVVVDDGSTDSTPALMDHLAKSDARINYVRLPKNFGRSEARNIGNKAASGKYILVLDADDVAYPERASLSVSKFKAGADMVHGSADYIDAIGSRFGSHMADVFNLDRAIKEKMNRMVHSTVGYTKDLAMRIPYRGGEISALGIDDWAFQIEAACSGAKIEHITPVICGYRELSTSISATRDEEKVLVTKEGFMEGLKSLTA